MNTSLLVIDFFQGLELDYNSDRMFNAEDTEAIMRIWTPLALGFERKFEEAGIKNLRLQWRVRCRVYNLGRKPKRSLHAQVEVIESGMLPRTSLCMFTGSESRPRAVFTMLVDSGEIHLPSEKWPLRRTRRGFLTLKAVLDIWASDLVEKYKREKKIL